MKFWNSSSKSELRSLRSLFYPLLPSRWINIFSLPNRWIVDAACRSKCVKHGFQMPQRRTISASAPRILRSLQPQDHVSTSSGPSISCSSIFSHATQSVNDGFSLLVSRKISLVSHDIPDSTGREIIRRRSELHLRVITGQ
ncbi:hypothetical protein PIB30_037899 [Stylosanthes scabra]|uniref:Uncharacterized protein n=1 Tax=Stylosanthes scabra TaxID=79078 RepID=A0ABU6QEE7_9FABA|nr:hypothetical protein [Stylosanthes scabra]